MLFCLEVKKCCFVLIFFEHGYLSDPLHTPNFDIRFLMYVLEGTFEIMSRNVENEFSN